MVPTDNSSSSPIPSSANPRLEWQRDYQAMLTEADRDALFKRVEIAEASIRTRLDELKESSDHHAERGAMEEALANLRVVKRDRLKFR